MKVVINILFTIFAVLSAIILLVGIFMLINGSFEAFPTEEQIEKVRIIGVLLTIVGSVIELLSVIVLCKNNK